MNETTRTFKEAIEGPEANLWKSSMNSEMNSLIQNRTWEIIDEKDVPTRKLFSNANGYIVSKTLQSASSNLA